ncbi:MAG TPA: 3-hydroxyacyl-CoA dehydrogenase NAD-binding domain-containing protein, partial [Candidatus Eisenbacteria bacterium]|nr:3-hydroxyacyl-CoA dehydrogenase NAD-binding domain-containing protein [Candidatus Eisenbacteria bacterium]
SVRKRTGGNYPAPLAALRVIEHGLGQPLQRGFDLEAAEVAPLVTSPVCKNLVRIFLQSERAKKEPLGAPPAPVRSLVVAGAGVMGAGIAELATRRGIAVRMRDVSPEAVTRGLRTIRGLVEDRLRRRRATRTEAGAQLARLMPALDLQGLGRCDAAIEAVVEDLDVKRRVFAELEVRLPARALLATNTSSLSVNALAAGLEHAERLCGFHFFNPVHRMPLVEVVRGDRTSPEALATAVALARTLGKTPVVVSDAPGFVVNRVLMPYLREALHLAEEGWAVADVDRAMRGFGMPMGPFEVVDEVGIDVAAKVAAILARAFPDRMSESPVLGRMVEADRFGRKTGAGFYRYRGRRREPDPAVIRLIGVTPRRRPERLDALAERMALVMVNEAARCLEDQIAADAGMIDLAMVLGAGFPPFRGGPLRWADALGAARVESRLNALRGEKGDRFRPAPLVSKLANEGRTFTPPPTPAPTAAAAS